MALIIGVVIVLLILFGFLCYKKAPPTEAIVVTGFGLARPKVVCGKGTFVLPVLQRADRLNMRLLKIDVKTPETGVKTQNGVSLWIDSVVTIQVYSENSTVLDEEVKASGLKDAKAYIMSRQQAAISNFLGMNEQGINDKVNDVLQGNLREIVSDMTVDQILTNRKQMALSVIENARPDLAKMGLEVVTFNVQDIRDAIDGQGHNHGVIEAISLDGAPNFNGVTVSVEELKTLPINGYMALNREDEGYSIKGTSEEYDAEEEIDRDIQDYCVTGEEGNYYQIGSYATDGSYAMMLNEDIAKEGGMTFGDAFDKGLYYSRINVYDFDWFPAYDSPAQEKFEALYDHFGNPSGLYWKTTTFGGMTFSSFDELKAATYEDVGEAKSYWLVWNCDGYTLAAECYDQFDGKETPQETSVTSICVFPDADESYISHVDAGSVVDGYVGCGEAPLCLSGIKTEG